MKVFEKIEAQQKGKEYTDAWGVGQQLKDILHNDSSLEEIVDKDLDAQGMSLVDCAKKIKAWAEEQHKKTNTKCVCVPPEVAEKIIRDFYGLPEAGMQKPGPAAPAVADVLDLSTFF